MSEIKLLSSDQCTIVVRKFSARPDIIRLASLSVTSRVFSIAGDFANSYRFGQTVKEVAERSILIKNMLEDVGEVTEAIPIPNV